MAWYWDERTGRRRRQRRSPAPTASLPRFGPRTGLAVIAGAAVAGAVAGAWSATLAAIPLLVAGAAWWALAMREHVRDGQLPEGELPDHTVDPRQAARIESAEGVAADLGFGGGSGGDGGGSGS